MASNDRRSSPDLKDDLFTNTDAYSFYQVVRLLRRFITPNGGDSSATIFQERLRVRPPLSLGFPGSDLARLQKIESHEEQLPERYLLSASFLGLYGVSSPLPVHYTEELFEEAHNDKTVTRDFFDAISQPFYRLLFQCWSKYRIPYRIVEEQDSNCLSKLFCLQGLGLPSVRQNLNEPHQLLRYLGLFTMSSRSALGLKILLSDALQMRDLQLDPCIARRVSIPDNLCNRLGKQGATLGVDSYLGQETDDRMGKIRISISSLDPDTFHSFLPPTIDEKSNPASINLYSKTKSLLEMYLSQPIEYDLKLVLKPEAIRTVVLGESPWSRLGLDSWMFSGNVFPGTPEVTIQCNRL